MDKNEIIKRMGAEWLCLIMRGDTADETIRTFEALIAGGAKIIEAAFTTPNVCEAIRHLRKNHGDNIILSAGTVRTAEQAQMAVDAGAQVIVSPNLYSDVVETALKNGCVSMPGCVTPSEVDNALRMGADLIKLFPCSPLGPEYLSYLIAPMPEAKIVPAGSITLDNMKDYYARGAFGGVAGVTTEMQLLAAIKAGKWSEVTNAARHWTERVREML